MNDKGVNLEKQSRWNCLSLYYIGRKVKRVKTGKRKTKEQRSIRKGTTIVRTIIAIRIVVVIEKIEEEEEE